jgi:hydrogenase-4 component F
VDAVPTIHANTWFLVFGIISVGTAAFLLFQVRDYKRLFAFSTIEHMGIIMSAVGLGGASAYSGAMLQMVGHAVTKSFCFYASGCVLILMETRDIASVRGLIRKAPGTGTALLLGGLAIAGSPPFVVFLGEFSILKTGLQQGKYLAVGLLVFFIVIAFIAIMNHISRMVFGVGEEIKPVGKRPDPFPLSCKITLILTAVPLITLGIFIPGVLNGLIVLAAATIGG